MIGVTASMRRIVRDRRGAAAIEAALATPLLVLISLGSFETSNIIARQSELQASIAEASAVALAAEPTTASRRETLRSIIETSTGLDAESVTVDAAYRCGAQTQLQSTTDGCDSNLLSSYVEVTLTDSYTPIWTKFGIGQTLNFSVSRLVMVKQQID